MKKYKLLQSLIDYLIVENPSTLKDSGQTSEKDVIMNLVQENLRHHTINPPENILQNLKKQEIEKIKFRKRESGSFWKVIRYAPAFAVPGLIIIVIMVIWNIWNPSMMEQKESVQLSTIGSNFVPVNKGMLLEKTGIRMSSAENGVIAFESSFNNNHFMLKEGNWNIETDHTKLEKETWFHFPGGGVKPIGTKFSIQIENEMVRVQLIEGKIQTYSVDKIGHLESSFVQTAPFHQEFPASGESFKPDAVEALVTKANSIVVEPETQIHKKEESSVYRNFIGSKITVMSKEGLKITGILENVVEGKLQIRTDVSLQTVEESKVTLMGLDSHPGKLEKDPFFPE